MNYDRTPVEEKLDHLREQFEESDFAFDKWMKTLSNPADWPGLGHEFEHWLDEESDIAWQKYQQLTLEEHQQPK